MPTSVKALYVEEMQAVLVKLEGIDEEVLLIFIDASALRVVPLLSERWPLGHELFLPRLGCLMLTHTRHDFLHGGYLLRRLCRS